MTGNQVFITNDGLIEIIVCGDQTYDSVEAMGKRAFKLARQQRQAGMPAIILDNLLQIGTVPTEARRLVVDMVKSDDYDKLAMLGKGTALRLGANLMLQATGKGKRVRYFEDRDHAIRWLMK